MLLECFSAWLLDKCPGFVIPACLVPCHPCEEAVKHSVAALGKVNLQAQQGEHWGSKIEMGTLFDGYPWSCLPTPAGASASSSSSSEPNTSRCLGVHPKWQVLEPAGCCCAPTGEPLILRLKHLKKKKSFVFCPTCIFCSGQNHQFPSPRWDASLVSTAREQLLRGTWLHFSIPTGV